MPRPVPLQKRCLVLKFQQISNKSLPSLPPSHAYLIQVAGGVIFHLQQVVVYILDKLRPYHAWHGCLYLLQQLLFRRPLARAQTETPSSFDGNDSCGGWAGAARRAQLQTPAVRRWLSKLGCGF